ncbi:type I pullulanase [Clostridium peptidivorans]|uniref:type I pullulanase n=1 Tax=Clostridium peptidivorans TaxID=100174 RepID=UPI000BE43C8E|nr:type I pullulanase [Clostridium peptidivorans]
MRLYNAELVSFDTIKLKTDNCSMDKLLKLKIRNGLTTLRVKEYYLNKDVLQITLNAFINIKEKSELILGKNKVSVNYYPLYKSDEFNKLYYYAGNLGYTYSSEETLFSLWSPIALSINLLIYDSGDPSLEEKPRRAQMKEYENGVWRCSIKENLDGYFYTYEINIDGIIREVIDPYTPTVGINGLRGAIINLNKSNPKNFEKDSPLKLNSLTDAIIYELSIRDMSTHPNSGIINRAKFLGLSEDNTYSNSNIRTGLSHVKELGITHVQLMPIFDFSHINSSEKYPLLYNWGYDPENYNSVEGIYATDPYNPYCRIQELKTLIYTFHKNNIGVNMDVVYNHVFNASKSNFENIFPKYYFRYNEDGCLSNGSGCGNDIASENPMVRKFIVDSVKFWAKEYHLDGFRFDLMGIHDLDTMNIIRDELYKINPYIIIYGEGWNLNTSLPEEKKATQKNFYKIPYIGHFNDFVRDSIKGSTFIPTDIGYASGKEDMENNIKICASGSINYNEHIKGMFQSPINTINYVSAHDNHTLWDKIELSCRDKDFEEKKYIHKLCNAIVLTSQGISFLHSGVEFCRTKNMDENSYKSPDIINWMDWDRKEKFIDVNNYYKGLIKLRKEHTAFKMNNADEIRKHLLFLENTPKNIVAFILKDHAQGDSWKDILVIYNPTKYVAEFNIPVGTWKMVVNRDIAGTDLINTIEGSKITVEGISTTVMYK